MSALERYLLSLEETLGFFAGSIVRLLPVPRCMSAWCPTCNTLGLFRLYWDASNGPGLPVHVRCLICPALFADYWDSAMILVLLHVWPCIKSLAIAFKSVYTIGYRFPCSQVLLFLPADYSPSWGSAGSEWRTLSATYYYIHCITVLCFLIMSTA